MVIRKQYSRLMPYGKNNIKDNVDLMIGTILEQIYPKEVIDDYVNINIWQYIGRTISNIRA